MEKQPRKLKKMTSAKHQLKQICNRKVIFTKSLTLIILPKSVYTYKNKNGTSLYIQYIFC